MRDFVECKDCEFVFMPEENDFEPVPRGREECPNCGGDEFRYTDEAV